MVSFKHNKGDLNKQFIINKFYKTFILVHLFDNTTVTDITQALMLRSVRRSFWKKRKTIFSMKKLRKKHILLHTPFG